MTKRQYIHDWALKNPGCTIDAARKEVERKFKSTLGSGALVAIVRIARGEHRKILHDNFSSGDGFGQNHSGGAGDTAETPGARVRRGVKPPSTTLHSLVDIMKAGGYRMIKVNDDGSLTVKMADGSD